MSNPIDFRAPPSTGLVPLLTELLARAQRGEITQIAVAFIQPGGIDYGYGIFVSDRVGPGGDHASLKLIGAVADLQYTLLKAHNDQQ